MSTARSRTGDLRRVAKGALAAALVAMLMWGAAAVARSSVHRPSGARAGNSWSAKSIVQEIDGVSWS